VSILCHKEAQEEAQETQEVKNFGLFLLCPFEAYDYSKDRRAKALPQKSLAGLLLRATLWLFC
jgi:hypothetical protein